MSGTGDEPGTSPIPRPAPSMAEQPYGPPAMASPFGQQPPPVGWPTPPPLPARSHRGAVIATAIVSVMLLVACCGLVGGTFLLRSVRTAASGQEAGVPLFPATGASASPNAGAEPSESEQAAAQGPQASAYPATERGDLDRVCDESIYYPQSPKRAGKAPHPVVLLVKDGSGVRFQDGTYYFSQGLSKRVEQSWAAEDPKKVQMVACLDRTSAGAKIRSCKYDDPEPETVTLLRAGWRLRVYEVATGRVLLNKTLGGDDQKCPSLVLIYEDKKIYAKVSDRVVVGALRNLVNK